MLGGEVRLRYGYVIKCHETIKDEQGNIVELRCTYDPDTLGKKPEGRKVKGVIHWVSAVENIPAEVRLYSSLFSSATPDASENLEDTINSSSLSVLKDCRLESSLANAEPGKGFQFEREGYFCLDSKSSVTDKKVFNLTVPLRDTWDKKA